MSARGSPPAATPLTRRARHAPTIVSNYRLMTPPHATKNLSFIVCCCCFRKPGRVEAAASSTSTLDVSHAHVDRMHTACALHTKRSPTQPIAAALDSPPPLPREGQAQQDEAEARARQMRAGGGGGAASQELRARLVEWLEDDHEQDVRLSVREPGVGAQLPVSPRPVQNVQHGW